MGSRKNGRLKHKDHAQDCGILITSSDQHPAILPWSSNSGWHPSFRAVTGSLPRPAAGLLLDDLAHDHLSRNSKVRLSENHAKTRATGARVLFDINGECCASRAAPCNAPHPSS